MHQCFLISPPCRRVQPGSATAWRSQMPTPQQCLTCPQETKHNLSGEEEEGRLLPPCSPASLLASRAGPRPAPWLGLCRRCRSSGPCPAVVWVPMCAFLPAGDSKCCPMEGQGGKVVSPSKSPTDSCLASFERRRELGSTLSVLQHFPSCCQAGFNV